jgi:hypothetical protein
MSEKRCHRLQSSSGMKLTGNESPNEACLPASRLRALSRELRVVWYTMKDFTEDAMNKLVNIRVMQHEEFQEFKSLAKGNGDRRRCI